MQRRPRLAILEILRETKPRCLPAGGSLASKPADTQKTASKWQWMFSHSASEIGYFCSNMKLFVAGLTYETAPVELRKQVASRSPAGGDRSRAAAGLECRPLPSFQPWGKCE